jgi:hypothetical protein
LGGVDSLMASETFNLGTSSEYSAIMVSGGRGIASGFSCRADRRPAVRAWLFLGTCTLEWTTMGVETC